MRDFYALGAFFADVKEAPVGRREKGMLVIDAPQARELARLENELAHAQAEFKETAPECVKARRARDEFEESLPRTLITEHLESPRAVRVLPRGDWMNANGERVDPALPAALPSCSLKGDPAGRPLTRLDLANWLVSAENPLTARVFVNRLWKQFFGAGLAPTLDDFGTHGEAPSDPVLLDWLACEFMDSGWNIKHLTRLIVTSATYRQVSIPTPAARERDPDNRFWTRQGRFRLEAELVRDNALAVAGLLNLIMGGPSVKPYQPEHYWENLNFPKRAYDPSTGADQYRRGLYTWWQRSFPHPSLLAFDAPSREECVAERTRSNIPQQALILLNDPTYLEASAAFAARILRQAKGDDSARITWAWRQTLARTPQPAELATVRSLLRKHRAEYQGDRTAAAAYLRAAHAYSSAADAGADLDPAEWAAWINVARTLLNLHETITRS
jgi:hypothetical protein